MCVVIGSLVGKGNTADVFDAGNGRVVKLFHAGYPKNSVCREFKNSCMLNELDIPIVKSYEMITLAKRYGIVYDKIEGASLQDILLQTRNIEKYATILAQMHKKILCKELRTAISFKSILRTNIEHTDKLNGQSKIKLCAILDTLPEGNRFCHGDFHFGNILMAQQKLYIIDYMNVCQGHEYCDIARTVYLIEMTPVPTETHDKETMLLIKKRAVDIYLKEMGLKREHLTEWLKVIAAARLSELSNEQIEERSAILEFLSIQGL